MSIYDEFNHIIPINETGAVSNAYNESELHKYIDMYICDKTKYLAERKRLVEKMLPVNRGCAGEVLGNYLAKLA